MTLIVPYRQADDEPLRAFDERHEAEALTTIASELAPTLIKLAHSGPGKSLSTVVLRSGRLGHELRWRQFARAGRSAPNTIRRTARLEEHGTPLDDVPEAITEMEYHRVVTPPTGLARPNIPSYFRVPAGRIRLGVSVRIHHGRLDLRTSGIFYYPIGASRSRTGFGFSLSAPFEMNEDRSQLVDTQNSDWNAWLIRESAAFAIRLLPERLFAAFGPEAFLAFGQQAAGASTVPALVEEIDRLLRTEPCWPTRATTGRTRRPVRAPVGSLAIPVSPALADFTASTLRPEDVLHAGIAARSDTRAIATELGGKVFTLSSLVRLRCSGGRTARPDDAAAVLSCPGSR